MKFEVTEIKREGIEFIQLRNSITNEFIEIIPAKGGTINRIVFNLGDGARDILCFDSDEEHHQNIVENAWFRGRILFPFNDMIPEGKYKFNGNDYQLEINIEDENFSLHGFQYTKNCGNKIVDCTDNAAELILQYCTDGSDKGYPFKVNFNIKYTLSDVGLRVDFKVKNLSDQKIPVAFGWHLL